MKSTREYIVHSSRKNINKFQKALKNLHQMDLLKWEHVKSTQIKQLGFDAKNKTLYIRFRNKKMYSYNPVNQEEYDEFKNSESIGKYFYKNIKKRAIVK